MVTLNIIILIMTFFSLQVASTPKLARKSGSLIDKELNKIPDEADEIIYSTKETENEKKNWEVENILGDTKVGPLVLYNKK